MLAYIFRMQRTLFTGIDLNVIKKLQGYLNDKIFFTSSNGERSFSFTKYAQKKILNLTLVNFFGI